MLRGRRGLPAAQGFGETEGRDYRGVRVFAVFRPVEGSPWVLIAKVDRSETYRHPGTTASSPVGRQRALLERRGIEELRRRSSENVAFRSPGPCGARVGQLSFRSRLRNRGEWRHGSAIRTSRGLWARDVLVSEGFDSSPSA